MVSEWDGNQLRASLALSEKALVSVLVPPPTVSEFDSVKGDVWAVVNWDAVWLAAVRRLRASLVMVSSRSEREGDNPLVELVLLVKRCVIVRLRLPLRGVNVRSEVAEVDAVKVAMEALSVKAWVSVLVG